MSKEPVKKSQLKYLWPVTVKPQLHLHFSEGGVILIIFKSEKLVLNLRIFLRLPLIDIKCVA